MNKKINDLIKDHEIAEKDWLLHTDAKEYYLWMDRFNKKFFNSKLETSVLSFARTSSKTLGHYNTARNAIGVENNINLNCVHLGRAKWKVLTTLLHEMGHQWQRREGSFSDKKNPSQGNYHNKEFIDMMQGFGLSYNKKGQRIAPPEGIFVEFLKKYKVEIVKEDEPTYVKPVAKSKLRKYSCQCEPPINIRVAVKEISITCNRCGKDFEEQ